jgi:hypothetical protein
MTWTELIRLSLQIGNLVPRGQEAAPEYNLDGQIALPLLLSEWSRDGIIPPNYDSTEATLTAGQFLYTAGSGGNFTKRPQSITQAVIFDGSLVNVRIPIEVRPWAEFEALTYRIAPGIPKAVYLNMKYPLAEVGMNPAPSTNYKLRLVGIFPWDAIVFSSQVSLAPGMEPAIADNLALKMCENYNRNVPDWLRNRARDGRSGIVCQMPPIDAARGNELTYRQRSRTWNWLADSPT